MSTEREKAAKEVFDKVIDALNCFDNTTIDVFTENISRVHRTLQQNFWRMIQQMAREYAKLDENECYDLRNEAAVKWCKRITEATNDLGMPYV